MKKLLLGLTLLIGAVGHADLLEENQAFVPDEPGDRTLYSVIEKTTGAKARKDFKGQFYVSAKATVSCFKSPQGENSGCIVTINKK